MFNKIFAPDNNSPAVNLALLVMRLWLGLTMLFNHGLDKLIHFHDHAATFPDPLGIGHPMSLALAVFAEAFGSLLLTIGLLTRFAALILVTDMTVAFLMVHRTALSGPKSGELAFIYLSGYVALFIAGGGMISLDKIIFGRNKKN